jgi:hypothetical protein
MKRNENTRLSLKNHVSRYPKLEIEDIFKYLFQSSFGCEHLVQSREHALSYIKREYEGLSGKESPFTDPLDGGYSRVHLSWLNAGLSPETLTKLFCLSARVETDGRSMLLEKLETATQMVRDGELPFDANSFDSALALWKKNDFPAIHHSEIFRAEYHPSYRVIANEFVPFLPLFAEIDRLLSRGDATVAIEGGSASGKSTLADMLSRVYACNIFHMDDFFLRPDQRTNERLSEIGGNIDRERFLAEVLLPLSRGEEVKYRRFDCASGSLTDPITAPRASLSIIEGVYSMHPSLSPFYDLSVFLNIDSEYQKERILKRNSPSFARRFFDEWIPLENLYFSKMRVKEKCCLAFDIREDNY